MNFNGIVIPQEDSISSTCDTLTSEDDQKALFLEIDHGTHGKDSLNSKSKSDRASVAMAGFPHKPTPKKKEKSFCSRWWKEIILGCIACIAYFAVAFYLITQGSIELDATLEWNQASNETCILMDYTSTNCSSGSSSSKMQYRYYAKTESKCGNETTLQSDYDECGDELRDFDKGETDVVCYVEDCSDGTFRFEYKEQNLPLWFVSIGSLMVICPYCFLCCFGLEVRKQLRKHRR